VRRRGDVNIFGLGILDFLRPVASGVFGQSDDAIELLDPNNMVVELSLISCI